MAGKVHNLILPEVIPTAAKRASMFDLKKIVIDCRKGADWEGMLTAFEVLAHNQTERGGAGPELSKLIQQIGRLLQVGNGLPCDAEKTRFLTEAAYKMQTWSEVARHGVEIEVIEDGQDPKDS